MWGGGGGVGRGGALHVDRMLCGSQLCFCANSKPNLTPSVAVCEVDGHWMVLWASYDYGKSGRCRGKSDRYTCM